MGDLQRVDYTPSGLLTKHGTRGTYNRGCRCNKCSTNHSETMKRNRERRLRKVDAGEASIPHGTPNAYSNYYCRCELCKEAGAKNNKRVADRKKTGKQRIKVYPDVVEKARQRALETPKSKIPHGLTGYANYNCRCDTCKKARSEYHYRRKKEDR